MLFHPLTRDLRASDKVQGFNQEHLREVKPLTGLVDHQESLPISINPKTRKMPSVAQLKRVLIASKASMNSSF